MPNPVMVKGMEETDSDSVDDILIKDPNLPNTFESFLPLLVTAMGGAFGKALSSSLALAPLSSSTDN